MTGGTIENMDHKKDAALIAVNLSIQLITASISFIAITGGIVGFILTSKNANWIFNLLYFGAFTFFILSIVFGGKGIEFVKQKGDANDWKTRENGKSNWFAFQSIFIVGGVLCMIVLPFTGQRVVEEENKNLAIIKKLIEQEISNDSIANIINAENQRMASTEINILQQNIKDLNDTIEVLKDKVKNLPISK